MRAFRLSTLLIALNASLLALVLAFAALYAGRLLGRAFDENARQRVALAAAAARQTVEEEERAVALAARLLGERPTLGRLVRSGAAAEAVRFLESFRRTNELSGCAIVRDDAIWAQSGAFPAPSATGWIGDASPVAGVPGATVLAVREMDEAFAAEVAARAGLPVRFVSVEALEDTASPRRRALWREATREGRPAAGRLEVEATYTGVDALAAAAHRPAMLIETTLPAAAVDAARDAARRSLAGWCAAVALAGVAASFIAGRAAARPVERLTRSAVRIGSGDLETAVRPEPGAEIGALAAAMEEMRGRLLALTSELERRRAEAEAILAGIVEGVMTVDEERRIQYLNPRAAALLGIPADAAGGRFCGDVLRPEPREGLRPCEEDCPIVHARFQGRSRAVEHLAPLGGEHRTVVITSAAPSEGRQILLLRDETEIESTRRLRDAVLAHISHEFKTPLAAQLASIEMLRDRLGDASGQDSAALVESLERGTLRLTRLIDNLLESARIESGQLSIRRQAVDLDGVIHEAADSMGPLLAQRRQRLRLDLPRPLPEVEGDAPRLVQVFVNLLANANKFAPPDSTITVTGEVGGEGVTLSVEDEGPGLPDMPNEALFSRFTRALGEEPEESGLGLGLWIAKSIVERHGGTIRPSRGRRGARMSVTLPWRRA
jgi:signal transduction histidine kinase/HAMP domain-containing protein